MAPTDDYTHKAASRATNITGASNTTTIDGVTYDIKVAGMTNSISLTGLTTSIEMEESTNFIKLHGPGYQYEGGECINAKSHPLSAVIIGFLDIKV
jgi:hypothetical protein